LICFIDEIRLAAQKRFIVAEVVQKMKNTERMEAFQQFYENTKE